MILSSHILSEVSAICDHIMIISKGKLVASDTADNLLNMMEPVTTLKMTVSGDGELLENIFSDISDIQNWEYDESAENIEDGYDLKINYASGTDLRRDIFTKLVKNGFIIYMMDSSSVTLEDVFMELTAEERTSEENDSGEEADTAGADAETESDTDTDCNSGEEVSEEEISEETVQEEDADEEGVTSDIDI